MVIAKMRKYVVSCDKCMDYEVFESDENLKEIISNCKKLGWQIKTGTTLCPPCAGDKK